MVTRRPPAERAAPDFVDQPDAVLGQVHCPAVPNGKKRRIEKDAVKVFARLLEVADLGKKISDQKRLLPRGKSVQRRGGLPTP